MSNRRDYEEVEVESDDDWDDDDYLDDDDFLDDDDALLEGEDRGNTAIRIIEQMIDALQTYYDELKDEVDVTKDSFDHGLMTGYRHALEMLQNRAYGLILPDPNKNNE